MTSKMGEKRFLFRQIRVQVILKISLNMEHVTIMLHCMTNKRTYWRCLFVALLSALLSSFMRFPLCFPEGPPTPVVKESTGREIVYRVTAVPQTRILRKPLLSNSHCRLGVFGGVHVQCSFLGGRLPRTGCLNFPFQTARMKWDFFGALSGAQVVRKQCANSQQKPKICTIAEICLNNSRD